MSWGPLRLRTVSEGITFDGEASPAPGGGSKQGIYAPSGSITVADASAATVDFSSFTGDDLLDITNPNNPLVREGGLYSLMVVGFCTTPLTAGGYITVHAGLGILTALTESIHPDAGFTVLNVCLLAGGDPVAAAIDSFDGAATRTFDFSGLVVTKLL